MCGIVGVVAAHGSAPPSRARLEQATKALSHRGPDGSGIHLDGRAGLGHTRLSIIDVEGGAQPLRSEDGKVVAICNGEIWNHAELRQELERAGHRFRTRSDVEVLPHGYEEWGEGLLDRIRGMYALAIWDAAAGRLLLARDRLGKKPLYVARSADGVVFGSDARSIGIVEGRLPRLACENVAEFLFQRYVSAPRTLIDGVEKLRPGHLLTYDGERVEERAYWRVEPGEPRPLPPAELRELLRESVRERLMSDVPLGVLLSGGVDSTAVLGLMREAGAGAVASFTIGFGNRLYDERSLARLAATRYATEHHEIVVDEESFLAALPRLSWYRDEPIAEPSEVPLLLLAEAAGKHVKVVLTGDGGDELFGGYPKYRAERLLRSALPGVPLALRAATRVLAMKPSHRRLARAFETLAIRDRDLRWASWFRTFSPLELVELLAPDLRTQATPERLARPLLAALAPYEHLDPGRLMLLGDLGTYLPDNMLLRSDKVLMGASVEGRMPLLDHRIVERVSDVPIADRVGLRQGKAILRAAVADLIPDEIRRAPKRGFPVPVARFLAGGTSSPFGRLLLSERTLERGLLDADRVRGLVLAGSSELDRELKLFTLASLELWLRQNIDEQRLCPAATLGELLDDVPTASPRAARLAATA